MNKNALILVVDDDPVMLRATGRLLKSAGYEVIKAGTGSDALRLAKEQEPDLVLLDVVLLDMDGLEVCRRIKADPQLADIYVILGNCSGTLAKASRKHVANAITAFARVSKVLCVCPCPPHCGGGPLGVVSLW
jgi:CheY-like chemotaxis protein